MVMKHDESLFDPATRDRVRRDVATGTIIVFVVFTLIAAGLVGVMHRELPFLARMTGQCSPGEYAYECDTLAYDVVAGLIGFVLFGAFAALAFRYRRIAPTVRCGSCGGRGWVMDLEPREGRCPRCGGDAFSYRTVLAGSDGLGPVLRHVEEAHVAGTALVDRFRRTRGSLFDRYY
jgi:hypothetical protein